MLVKRFQLETSYLATIVDNSADILISYFYPNNEFVAIVSCLIFCPSRETETTIIGRAITPRFIGSFCAIPAPFSLLQVQL